MALKSKEGVIIHNKSSRLEIPDPVIEIKLKFLADAAIGYEEKSTKILTGTENLVEPSQDSELVEPKKLSLIAEI